MNIIHQDRRKIKIFVGFTESYSYARFWGGIEGKLFVFSNYIIKMKRFVVQFHRGDMGQEENNVGTLQN